MREMITALDEALQRDEPVALATVVEVKDASPAQVGFKLLVRPDGSVVGNLGGGALEQRGREEAVTALQEGQSPKALMALIPLQPLREAEAKALSAEAVETARSKMDALKAKLEL